jgi:hypothetical protein
MKSLNAPLSAVSGVVSYFFAYLNRYLPPNGVDFHRHLLEE